MWLPKDERIVLRKYYHHLQSTQEYFRFKSLTRRTYISTQHLLSRGLIHQIEEGGPERLEALAISTCQEGINLSQFLVTSESDIECEDITLRLTLKGYDLAIKYNHWFTRTGLWFAEYKHHWLWVVSSFAGGIMGALIVEWLK